MSEGGPKEAGNPVAELVQTSAETVASVEENGKVDAPEKAAAKGGETGPPKRAVVSSVLAQLEQLIVSEEWRSEATTPPASPEEAANAATEPRRRRKVALPKLSELGRSVVTSYSLKAYVALLAPEQRAGISAWLSAQATAALAGLFHFPDSAAHFHPDDIRGGIVHVLKLALRQAYPQMSSIGYAAFEEAPPAVFVSPALHYELAPLLAAETGVGDVTVVERMEAATAEIEGRLDHLALERHLEAMEGRKPVLVVAVVGSTFLGSNDLISKLLELRAKHGFWLHVVGAGLAAMGLAEPPTQLLAILQAVDSLSLPLGQWLGLQAVPAVTLYKRKEALERPPTPMDYRDKLEALPWWIALQHLGPGKVTAAVDHAYALSRGVLSQLAGHKQLSLLGIPSAAELAAKVEKAALLPPTVILFKYASPHLSMNGESGEEASEEAVEYADCLNSWLAQGLIAECPQLGFHLAEPNGAGTCIRYSALESAGACGTTEADVAGLGRQLGETLGILEATVSARTRLPSLIAAEESPLVSLSVQKWAGVGAVAYVPSMVREGPGGKDPSAWGPATAQQVSHLNIELVHSLRSSDTAFSVGEDRHGLACVKFGMLADQADLEDLVRMVTERGRQIEESAQYMESLAALIKEGIDKANQDLRKESDDRLMQEGVMRQVPLVGGLLNWLSPLPKESSNIKGRAFDLKTGRIQSTEILYKHRLQVAATEGALTPVTPVETSQIPHSASPAPPVPEEQQNGEVAAAEEAKE